MPAPRDTYVNPLLTNVSVGYKPQQFVASEVFPDVTVEKETGVYFVEDQEHWRAPADANRGEFSRANRVANKLTTANYTLNEKSLETPISERVMKQYQNPFDPKANGTKLVKQKLLLQKEKALRDNILNGAAVSNDENSLWATTSTNIIDKAVVARNAILKAVGQDANRVLIGKDAMDVIIKNDQIVDRLKYTSRPDEATILSAVADFFGVQKVVIGKAVEDTSKEGQPFSGSNVSYIWGDNVIFYYTPDSAAIEEPAAGYHLHLRDAEYVDEWYEQEIKTTFVRANDFYDPKVVVAGAMYVYRNVA